MLATDTDSVTALRQSFLGWQCRVRQLAIRQDMGRPSSGMVASVSTLNHGVETSLGELVTLLNKKEEFLITDEFQHLYRKTFDPRLRVESVLKLLGEYYYQRSYEFSDQLTASFQPASELASGLEKSGRCVMRYRQFSQGFEVHCSVHRLEWSDVLYQSTFWHNILFNPNLQAQSPILVFIPDWSQSAAI